MQLLTVDQLREIATGPVSEAQLRNMQSFVTSINSYGSGFGMDQKYNLASLLGQVYVENGEFRYDREVWGPTPAQKKYEGREDLGNTQPGDGSKFRGYGPLQITGRYNVTRFYQWALENHEAYGLPKPPNFVDDPRQIVTDPWEGLSVLWYWHVGNPTGKSLNRFAKENNQLMVTKRVNGGKTHYAERLEYQARAALVLLGYRANKEGVMSFQRDNQPVAGEVDGIIGDKTRTALHLAMKGELTITEVKTEKVETEVTVPVKVPDLDKPWYKDPDAVKEVVTTIGVPSILSFFLDVPLDKLIVLGGLLLIGSVAWYALRRFKAARQDKVAQAIANQPPVLKSVTSTTKVV